jgi:glycosyltransferase involved in cell wall biosynthesis
MDDEINLDKKVNLPFFSIIIPTYNRANLLPIAIESVLKQSFSNWELIVVDDGSTDETVNLMQAYCAKDARVRYIYQDNAERSAARNNGINQSRGKYICFLDSDDYFLESRLQRLFEKIENSNAVKMYYTGLLIDEDGKEIQERAEQNIHGIGKFDDLLNATIHSQQVCISREILLKHQFNNGIRISEDLELWLRINEDYEIEYVENQFTIAVKEHGDRSINVFKNNVGLEQLQTLQFCFSKNHPGSKSNKKLQSKIVSNSFLTIFKYWFYQGKRGKSIQFLLKSILVQPKNAQTKYKLNLAIRLCLLQSFEKVKALI